MYGSEAEGKNLISNIKRRNEWRIPVFARTVKNEFAVFQYGYNLLCPKCKKQIDIFPDTDLWIETKWGKIGVAGNILASLGKVI